MRWFYFLVFLQIIPSFTPGQNCQFVDMIYEKEGWNGDLSSFDFHENRIRLNGLSEERAKMAFHPEGKYRSLFLRFSLDFPPSLSNQFRLHVFFSDHRDEEKKISFVIGETGDDDGVIVQLTEEEKPVSEQKLWHGKYGQGAHRCEWVLSITNDGLVLTDPVTGASEFIGHGMDNTSELYFDRIEVECLYTKTRRDRFFLHRMELWQDDYFLEYSLEPGDLFITEIMPGSSSYAPFIELYSALDEPVCLSGLVLEVEELLIDLPPWEFRPYTYYAVAAHPVEGISSSFSMIHEAVNSLLSVKNEESLSVALIYHGRTVHQTEIRIDPQSADYSHEMIDIVYPCRSDNWTTSHQIGGTPGMENSVFGGLDLPRAHAVWTGQKEALITLPYFEVDSADLRRMISVVPEGSSEVFVTSSADIHVKVHENSDLPEMKVHISGELHYCGNGSDQWDTILSMPVPVAASPLDVVVSEVMYDAPAGCPEYVEVAVLSEEPVWTGDLVLQREGGQSVRLDLPAQSSEPAHPKDFSVYVITRDKTSFEDCFPEAPLPQVVERELFILPNNGTVLRLLDESENLVLDEIGYDPSWHHEGYRDQKGIGLERDYSYPSSKRWRSGWPHIHFRSPGFLPSEWVMRKGGEIEFSTSTIRPGSGDEDEWLEIIWKGGDREEQGFLTIDIYDTGGNKVDQLISGFPVQGGEVFRWNGKTSQYQFLKEGIYLFWIYYFNNIGNDQIFKEKCVLLHP